ncbi:MAG: restriction endonuclease [Deltaproteobacteria bacterium]|nr:restriction endonuclease [Deltaproteobacteria bacterium]
MIIAARYSFNSGEEYINEHHSKSLEEIEQVIASIDAESCRLKKPLQKEIMRARRIGVTHFYSPRHLNALFDWHFLNLGWDMKPRIKTHDSARVGYREMDFKKGLLGVEVQMGKYAFLTYDIVAKMIIFKNLGVIDSGIEICPMASMLPHMSSGIGAFEQVVWDLEYRGISNLDIPVIVLGIESTYLNEIRSKEDEGEEQLIMPGIEKDPEVVLNRYLDRRLTDSEINLIRETGLNIEYGGNQYSAIMNVPP